MLTLFMHIHTDTPHACTPIDLCPAASIGLLPKLHCMCRLQAAASPTATPITPNIPMSSSSGACKGRGCNMYTGDGSGDYYGVLAASERDPPAYVQQLQQQQQPDQELAGAGGGSSPSGSQPGNEDNQPQFISTLVEQQPEHEGSSRQQRWLPEEQQVQAPQQLLQSSQDQPTQLDGQQAVVDGWQEQPRGQSEDGRPSRQTERSTGQKNAQVKNKKAPSRQHEGAFGGGQVLGGVSRRLGKTECERVAIWGHDKYLVTTLYTC